MLFYQLVAGAHVGGRHLFLRRELVFDDFKYPVESRQREHQHHHPANARRFDKLLVGAGDVVQVLTVAFRFRVLLAANRHIQFSGSFARQDLPQPLDQSSGQRGVNHKVGTREAKDDARLFGGGQAGIDEKLPFIGAMNRD